MSYSDTTKNTTFTNNPALATLAGAAVAGAALVYLLGPTRRKDSASTSQTGYGATDAISSAVRELTQSGVKTDGLQTTNSAQEAPLDPETDWDTSAHGRAFPTPPKPPSAFGRLLPPALGAIISPKAGGVAALIQSLRDQTWNPRTRNAALLGGALSVYSLFAKRSLLTIGAGMAGTALLAKGTHSAVAAARAAEAERAGSAPTVQIERTIRIDASPEDVFDMWAHYENFPRFMANVVSVRDLGSDLSHWTVRGPAGSTFEWDSILVERSRPDLLAWRSVPGSKVEQRGEVRIEPFRGGTRATVRMSYTPPAGKAGQAIATLLGRNPKAQLDEDLKRLKNLLERPVPPHALSKSEAARSRFLR